MNIKNIADAKDRTVTIEPDGSLKTKDGFYVFNLKACGYESKYDEEIPYELYILAKEEPSIEEIKNYLLADEELAHTITDWDEEGVIASWDEFVEIEKVRLA